MSAVLTETRRVPLKLISPYTQCKALQIRLVVGCKTLRKTGRGGEAITSVVRRDRSRNKSARLAYYAWKQDSRSSLPEPE